MAKIWKWLNIISCYCAYFKSKQKHRAQMSCTEDLPEDENPEPASGQNYIWALNRAPSVASQRGQTVAIKFKLTQIFSNSTKFQILLSFKLLLTLLLAVLSLSLHLLNSSQKSVRELTFHGRRGQKNRRKLKYWQLGLIFWTLPSLFYRFRRCDTTFLNSYDCGNWSSTWKIAVS